MEKKEYYERWRVFLIFKAKDENHGAFSRRNGENDWQGWQFSTLFLPSSIDSIEKHLRFDSVERVDAALAKVKPHRRYHLWERCHSVYEEQASR